MNLVMTENMFDNKHIYFTERVVNTVINNSYFIKILYSNQNIIITGVYILLNLKIQRVDEYFKKLKYVIDMKHDASILNRVFQIEKEILEKYNCRKNKKYSIREMLSGGNIKIYPNQNHIQNTNQKMYTFTLKISGIWENETEYGVTYKILLG